MNNNTSQTTSNCSCNPCQATSCGCDQPGATTTCCCGADCGCGADCECPTSCGVAQ